MKNLLVILFSFFILISFTKAETPLVKNAIPTGLGSVLNPDFGNDILVANANPIGPMHGILAPNGRVYVAINDTLLTSNLGLIVMQSSDNGNSWSLLNQGINLRTKYDQVKMLKTSDSILCFFRIGATITRWNPLTGVIKTMDITDAVDFDAAVSSDNSVYVFSQNAAYTVRRFGSTDGGMTFPLTGTLSTNAARPRINFSALGDTLIVNYRGPVRTDFPNKSVVRSGLIRQLAPGTLFSVTLSFADVITDTSVVVDDYKSVKYGPNVWTVWTTGTTGNIDMKCITSTTGGTIYNAPYTITSSTTRDEYLFDIGLSRGPITGLDIIYHSDSLQTGNPTNLSDKMYYQYSPLSAPNTVGPAVQFSEVPPVSTGSGCRSSIVELPGSDFGALFPGYTAAGNKVYWDRFSAITNISSNNNVIAEKFELKQNYPNPFNPTTNITFNMPKNSYVNLRVYDITGKEVANLFSGNMERGNYTVQFDGKNLTSGVYFYKLETENFSEVKKMSLIK